MKTIAHYHSKRDLKGFTLAELMIATAIVGVLSSVAVPAFQRYMSDARLTDGVMMLSHLRREQQDVYMRTMAWGTPRYSSAFKTNDPAYPALNPIHFSSRFTALVGSDNDPTIPAGSTIRSTQLPNSPLTDEFIGLDNLILGWGAYHSNSLNHDLYRVAVIGDVDGDSQRMMMFATPNVPLLVWCDDLNNGQEEALDLTAVNGTVGPMVQTELMGGGNVPAIGAGVRCNLDEGQNGNGF